MQTQSSPSLDERLAQAFEPGQKNFEIHDWLLKNCKAKIAKLRQDHKTTPWPFFIPNNEPGCATRLDWLNTKDNLPLSLNEHLKNKFIVVDFWTSCCINCIHVIAELENLEHKFRNFPEVAFIGVHSAKFDNEEALFMLRQAIRKYDVKHACINDCKFDVWNHFKLNNWPTLFVVGPDGNILQKLTEEGNVESVEHMLLAGLYDHNRRRKEFLESGDPLKEVVELNTTPLPLEFEKDKAAAQSKRLQGQADAQVPEEAIIALRQNLAQPGKVIVVAGSSGIPLPYEGVSSLLVIADSANNRYIVCDAGTHSFIESIGSGRVGYMNGSFKEAQFYHTQGLCHYINKENQYCLLLCDVKNHCIREANLHTKTVRHIAGVMGVRGRDTKGGERLAGSQELASPWDIVAHSEKGQFIVVMAGTHQIWLLDLTKERCECLSGSGAEGNENSDPETSTWAQPSGITAGLSDGQQVYFIADSESSAIRTIHATTRTASNLVGANDDVKDLFAFGDTEGVGFNAKLQHPLGVHFCKENSTLFVADTYNHKIKVMTGQDGTVSSETPLMNWVGVATEKNPSVVDGVGASVLLNEPNGCWALTSEGKFHGLYIADTGNDCIRFADPSGHVKTVNLTGVPDVRETASDCVGGSCVVDFGFSDDEESKDNN